MAFRVSPAEPGPVLVWPVWLMGLATGLVLGVLPLRAGIRTLQRMEF